VIAGTGGMKRVNRQAGGSRQADKSVPVSASACVTIRDLVALAMTKTPPDF